MVLALSRKKFSVISARLLRKALDTSRPRLSVQGSVALKESVPKIDFSKSVEDFKRNGIAILPVKVNDDFVLKSKKLCMSAWVDALARGKIIKGHELKLGQENGFKEIVLRAPGRYDMQWKVDGEDHFLDEENVLSKFMPFVHEVLGGPHMTKLNFNGCLMSLPGAKEQLWHIDGEHLFSSEENFKCNGNENVEFFKQKNEIDSILPAHCLNIFIPLVDVESNNGGTEFCVGSHFHTKFFTDDIVWQDSSWKDRIGFEGEVLAIKVNAGEVLAFDYRVLHRALKHGGKEARPLLYYTFTKRWFSDAMNFADLPSLKEAEGKPIIAVEDWRKQFPSIMKHENRIFCDGAAGSQVPEVVISKMRQHMMEVGSSNVGGDYNTSQHVLNAVTKARAAARDLLGAQSTGEIAFGLNCSNLMFHLARSMEDSLVKPGDNILLSKACHDANIAPWLHLAKNKKLEVRWLETVIDSSHSNIDIIDTRKIANLIDDKTRVISLGLASNATGRIHLELVNKINEIIGSFVLPPFLILDGTHYVPHRSCNLKLLQADAIICSAYKFFGPHIGVMAFNKERFQRLKPCKVGERFAADGQIEKDVLDPGDVPTLENCEISRWEMGTLNYEGLAGFEACVDYISSLAGENVIKTDRQEQIKQAYNNIQTHEEALSERFLTRLQPLLDENKLCLFGSRDTGDRTPTFAISLSDHSKKKIGTKDPYFLVKTLNERNILCTHGNHYAVELVEKSLQQVEGVTRISFLHYNTLDEVDRVIDELEFICQM